jgi:hypothetical protein
LMAEGILIPISTASDGLDMSTTSSTVERIFSTKKVLMGTLIRESQQLTEPVVDGFGDVMPGERRAMKVLSSQRAELALALVRRGSPERMAAAYSTRDTGKRVHPRGEAQWWGLEAGLRYFGWVFLPGSIPVRYQDALSEMDGQLRSRLAKFMADGNPAQAFLDQYCILHEEKFECAFRPDLSARGRAGMRSGASTSDCTCDSELVPFPTGGFTGGRYEEAGGIPGGRIPPRVVSVGVEQPKPAYAARSSGCTWVAK